MGYIDEFLAGVDNLKRTAAANVKDSWNNPALFSERAVDRLRNQNTGVVPTASNGELTNRPMTLGERVEDISGSLDPGHGVGGAAMGSIKNQKFFRGLFEPGGPMSQELKMGLHPEEIIKKYSLDDLEFRGTDRNVGIRYETNRPLYDKGVVHYDAAGGPQATEIMTGVGTGPRGGTASPSQMRKLLEASQLRVGSMKHIPEDSVIYTPYDRWFGEWGEKKRPTLAKGQHEFYPNELEGYPAPYPQEMPIPKARDILNDPDLRKEYNMSLAVPADSKFHMLAKILRDK